MTHLHRPFAVLFALTLALSGCAHVRGGPPPTTPEPVEFALQPLDSTTRWDAMAAMLEPIPTGLPEGVSPVDGLLLGLLEHHRSELEAMREADLEGLAECHYGAWKNLEEDARRVEAEALASDDERAIELRASFRESLADRLRAVEGGALDCSPPVLLEVAERGDEPAPYEVVDVFYGTDRDRSPDLSDGFYSGDPRCPEVEEGTAWNPRCLEVGVLQVSIPVEHQAGEVERPTWWKLEVREDPARHVILREVEPLTQERFVGQLRKAGSERPILVFVHGYNTSFEEAAWRAAQMVYDLREWEFDGRAALYSWASRGTLTGYRDDERNVEAAVPHLAAFLELLAAEAGDAPVHLVAHSMGNRALTGALTRIDGSQTSFEQVLLAAPDMDAEVFNKQVAPRVAQRCDRLTLYASSNDRALQISGYWHRNRPRAGDAAGGISTTDQLESIDASACDTTLLGHSYVADKPSVLIDVATILHGLAPSERGGWLEQLEGFVWRLIPDGLE